MRKTYTFSGETKKIRDWKPAIRLETPKNKWNTPEALGERELHRIIALPDNKWAAAGTIGGWIECEDNLHDGAWVADEACVYGDAQVEGNTLIEDNAAVYGNALLCGAEEEPIILSLDRIIHGGFWWKTPLYSACTPWTEQITSHDTFRIGCQDHEFKKWKRQYKALIRMGIRNSPTEIDRDMLQNTVDFFNRCCQETGHTDCMINVEEVLETFDTEKHKVTAETLDAILQVIRSL